MRVTIRKKNLEITPALAIYIETKLLKPIRKLLKVSVADDLPILDLEVGRTTKHHKKGAVYHVEANLSLGKIFFRAETDDADVYAACDIVEKELERELSSFKEKKVAVAKRAARKIKKDLRFDPAARLYRKGRIRDEGN